MCPAGWMRPPFRGGDRESRAETRCVTPPRRLAGSRRGPGPPYVCVPPPESLSCAHTACAPPLARTAPACGWTPSCGRGESDAPQHNGLHTTIPPSGSTSFSSACASRDVARGVGGKRLPWESSSSPKPAHQLELELHLRAAGRAERTRLALASEATHGRGELWLDAHVPVALANTHEDLCAARRVKAEEERDVQLRAVTPSGVGTWVGLLQRASFSCQPAASGRKGSTKCNPGPTPSSWTCPTTETTPIAAGGTTAPDDKAAMAPTATHTSGTATPHGVLCVTSDSECGPMVRVAARAARSRRGPGKDGRRRPREPPPSGGGCSEESVAKGAAFPLARDE